MDELDGADGALGADGAEGALGGELCATTTTGRTSLPINKAKIIKLVIFNLNLLNISCFLD